MNYIWLCLVIKLTCISHYKLPIFSKLCKDWFKSQNILIHMQSERMAFDMSLQNRCQTKSSFQLLEILSLCISPNELHINLGQLIQRFGNLIKPFDKLLLLICSQPKNAFNQLRLVGLGTLAITSTLASQTRKPLK